MPDFEVSLLEAGDSVAGLQLGDAVFTPLKTYLKKYAKLHQNRSLARTYVIKADAGRVSAYITLICGEVVAGDGQQEAPALDPDAQYTYRQYPAIKIARLAVDERARGQGVGKYLVLLAIGISKAIICPAVGCRFVMVDAKRDSVAFYRDKCSFRLLETDENKARDEPVMFFDLYNTD